MWKVMERIERNLLLSNVTDAGGMGNVSQSLAKAGKHWGATYVTSAVVEEILHSSGKAKGICCFFLLQELTPS